MPKKKQQSQQKYTKSLFIGILLIIIAIISTYHIVEFANTRPSSPVGDIILDNAPNVNLFALRFLLPLIAFSSAAILLLKNPNRFPAALKSIGLLYIFRAFFILITYLEAPAKKITLNQATPLLQHLPYKGNDLFFSGHVAFPFIIALLFWDYKKIRYSYIFLAICSGIIELLAKAHYSIDVFAAPFITYSIYILTQRLWPSDFQFENN